MVFFLDLIAQMIEEKLGSERRDRHVHAEV